MKHLSPEAIAWLRERIAWHNECERSKVKSISQKGAECRADLIDLMVRFAGGDREQLRQLKKEDL